MPLLLENNLKKVYEASRLLGVSREKARKNFLLILARMLESDYDAILRANARDCKKMDSHDPMLDRLRLTREQIQSMARDVRSIAAIQDVIHETIEKRVLKNGLKISKIRVPIGVIAVIYESRPNVTIDVAVLCVKSGNAAVLKGGRESSESNRVLARIIQKSLVKAGLPKDCILYIDAKDRDTVRQVLAMDKYIDIVIPRGGRGLIDFVRMNARMPSIETGAGVCHAYIDKGSDVNIAVSIVHNAKTQRPSVCNALDTLVIHKDIAKKFLSLFCKVFKNSNVEVRADAQSFCILKLYNYKQLKKASKKDFGTEFLSLKMSIKIVGSINEAIKHINTCGSGHSEAIISNNTKSIQRFFSEIDAACVYANASTRFTDGSVFGLGGEIGISTQKLHARGPMGTNELTTYKWIIEGDGQVRE
ncbi:MAG: glutamate-5-semialdehyde dehydrogenase [Parcubacteria group bacterium CG10_big_fil_rev_8_21_14_0_10_41_35]|nr:MAG: glutamate-5-semialdehyde dehydrogenase [Parcubacteria group bacterium CG10_big_fil_rev_8_21_14_0_10_41_35]